MVKELTIDTEQKGYTLHEKATEVPTRRSYPQQFEIVFNALREKCIEQHSKDPSPIKDGIYCNRTMDHWGGCWPDTYPGQFAQIQCPDIITFDTNSVAYRECTANGTWYVNPKTGKTWANYSMCLRKVQVTDDINYIYIFIGGFVLSLLMLIISLGIFIRFKQLRCDRISIHKNLFLSYIFTGMSWIFYYVLAALDGNVMLSNPIWCQVLHVICQYFVVSNFMWMFCEGLYLNTIMVFAFNSGKRLIISCYGIGWVFPLILASLYAMIRGSDKTSTAACWMSESNLQWIMYGPIVLSLSINVLFLANIVRLLVTKLRQMPDANQTRKATRATLILIPLLGLQYLLFPVRPETGSPLENFYHIAIALLISLQGAFVSLMYCFCNSEVLQLLKRKWSQHRLMRSGKLLRSTSTHITTYTTIDPATNVTSTYCSTARLNEPAVELSRFENGV
ncbi:calcitonin gene-related peptide type 1 receptor-like [Ruditapes philippinarum]|uniref:calcitonin gene-related peptide type 1 receptor-like n=1 Tax=Ruditapes philippinarum TaxID=129788 RepID=UPI00295A6218|nr:calcitonin gene-related peptide type 1 receptor-like [Ruditapes philippinarum]